MPATLNDCQTTGKTFRAWLEREAGEGLARQAPIGSLILSRNLFTVKVERSNLHKLPMLLQSHLR